MPDKPNPEEPAGHDQDKGLTLNGDEWEAIEEAWDEMIAREAQAAPPAETIEVAEPLEQGADGGEREGKGIEIDLMEIDRQAGKHWLSEIREEGRRRRSGKKKSSDELQGGKKPKLAVNSAGAGVEVNLPARPERADFETQDQFEEALAGWNHRVLPLLDLERRERDSQAARDPQ